MAEYTDKYGFEKAAGEDFFDIEVQNRNWDKAEASLKAVEEKVDNVSVPVKTVNNKTGDSLGNVLLAASDINASDGQSIEAHLNTLSSQTAEMGNNSQVLDAISEVSNKVSTISQVSNVNTSISNSIQAVQIQLLKELHNPPIIG